MPESNVELVRRGLEAVAAGHLDVLRELLDPDVRWHGAEDPGGGCQNRGEALAFVRGALAAGARIQRRELIDAGDRVVVVLGPAARPEDAEGDDHANVVTIRDGRIVEMLVYETTEEALRAAHG